MRRRLFSATAPFSAAWMLLAFCVATPAFGQAGAAGITGRVTDDGGLDVPGVTVTAASPALQVGQLTTVTDERGSYRLSPLPIGTFTVTYTLPGFQTVKQEDVRLTVGFVATINVVLKVGTLEETITVSGVAPTVDVTTTTTSTHLTKETLEMLPSTRNGVLSMMQQTPSIRGNLDIGGSNFSAVPSFKSYGQGSEQWSTLEGVLTLAPIGNSGAANYWDYSTFDETHVAAIGKGVEIPVRGVQFDAIVKSGGNDLHGSAYYSNTNSSFQSSNLDERLAAFGITSGNKLQKQWDLSGDLGGRIIRDKVWFYGGLRKRIMQKDILGVLKEDGSPAPHYQSQRFGTVKVSYQLNQSIRLVGFYFKSIKNELSAGVNVLSPWETRNIARIPNDTRKVEATLVRGNTVIALQTGMWGYDTRYTAEVPAVSTLDIVTQVRGGGATNDGNWHNQNRWHQKGSITWYKPNSFAGSHEVRSGFDYIEEKAGAGRQPGPFAPRQVNKGNPRPDAPYYSHTLIFQNGAPFQITTDNAPVGPFYSLRYAAPYVSDNWTIGRRLTLNLGLRYAYDNANVPEQCKDAGPFDPGGCIDRVQLNIWNTTAGRVSAAYDLTGDGRAALKGGWGRYYNKRSAANPEPFSPVSIITTTWRWRDLNGDRQYQAGEVDFNPNGADYVSQTGASTAVPDPDQPAPFTDQVFLGVERQLFNDLSVRVTGVYAHSNNIPRKVGLLRPYGVYNIPISRPDPGPDGRVGTADDPGVNLTYFDYPAAYAGRNFDLNTITTPEGEPDHTFKTIEVASTKRFSQGWLLLASFSATKTDAFSPEVGSHYNVGVPYNPNAEINTANHTWEWLGRISGTYALPWGVFIAGNLESRSGEKGARTVLLSGGTRIPTQVVNAEPLGSLNLPAIYNLDVRLDKKFELTGGRDVAVRLNIFNALNANTVTSWNPRSGATFLRPIEILPPRLFELSTTYTF